MAAPDELTPQEHRTRAVKNLARLKEFPPGSATYHGLVKSAIADVLCAIAYYLEPPPLPEIPGLPPGWKLETRQSVTGDRFWGYMLTSPDGIRTDSRYRWGSSDTALTAGIRAARGQEGEDLP